MTTTTNPAPATAPRSSTRRAVTVLAVSAATAAVWAVVELGFGYDLWAPAMGETAPMDIGIGSVLASSAVAGLAGWAALAALERWSRRPQLIWTVLASVVFLVSLGGPLSGEGVEAVNRTVLVGLHAVVAIGLIPGLTTDTQGGSR